MACLLQNLYALVRLAGRLRLARSGRRHLLSAARHFPRAVWFQRRLRHTGLSHPWR